MSRAELPNDLEIERNVIGCALWSSGEDLAGALHDVKPEHFYSIPNQLIWQAAVDVMRSYKKCDLGLLLSYFRSNGRLDEVRSAIMEAAGSIATNALAEQYAKKLKLLASLRQIAMLGTWAWNAARRPMPIEEEIVNGLVLEAQSKASTLDGDSLSTDIKKSAANLAIKEIENIKNKVVTTIATGIEIFDNQFGGLKTSRYMGIAARPGIGKSVLMEQLSDAMMMRGEPTVIISQDMSPSMLIQRMACRRANVSLWAVDNGKATDYQMDAVMEEIRLIRDSTLEVAFIESMTPESLHSAMMYYRLKKGVRYFFVDHIGHVNGFPREDPHLTIKRASSMIRNFIIRHDVFFGALAHLNRLAANTRPGPENISECDKMLGDVDQLLLLWKDKQKTEEFMKCSSTPVTFTVGKNRNGPQGEQDCMFEKSTMSFVNL